MKNEEKVLLLLERSLVAVSYLQSILDEVKKVAEDVVEAKCDVLGTHNQQLLIIERKTNANINIDVDSLEYNSDSSGNKEK